MLPRTQAVVVKSSRCRDWSKMSSDASEPSTAPLFPKTRARPTKYLYFTNSNEGINRWLEGPAISKTAARSRTISCLWRFTASRIAMKIKGDRAAKTVAPRMNR